VRDAARREEEVAGPQRHGLAGQVERDLAAEDIEALVLLVMDVQRRHVAGRHVAQLHEALGQDAGAGAEEVVLGRGGDGHGAPHSP
jgi:hypothetical protein